MNGSDRDGAVNARQSIQKQQLEAFRRGMYSRAFAVIMALWAGILTAMIAAAGPL